MGPLKKAVGIGFLSLALLGSGCSHGGIKYRWGSIPGLPLGRNFPNPQKLGEHNSTEKNGQIYTKRGGQIDTDHLRKASDFTKFFSEEIYEKLMKNEEKFTMEMREPSKYFIELNYPSNWQNLSQIEKERKAKDISIDLGAYITNTGCTWHEIITWHGWNTIFIHSEFDSAFSCEDNYSNILGVYLAEKVLRESPQDFNKGLTKALYEELQRLNAQPPSIAKKAIKTMSNRKRHFDIGLDDNEVGPYTAKNIPSQESLITYQTPTLEYIKNQGFEISFEIEPRIRKGKKILKIAGKQERINPEKDFHPIMENIRREAIRRYGPNVDNPNSD